MTDLDALIERVQGLSGPDELVGVDVLRAVDPFYGKQGHQMSSLLAMKQLGADPTHSLDAVLELVERKLPGWKYSMGGIAGGWAEDVYLLGPEYKSDGSRPDQSSPAVSAPTAPLALLLAFLHALRATGGGE